MAGRKKILGNFFSQWAGSSESPYLRAFSSRKNRSEVFNFVDSTPVPPNWRVPYGTWKVTIRNEGFMPVLIAFSNGNTILVNSRDPAFPNLDDEVVLDGAPYVERDDVFKTVTFSGPAGTGRLVVICDRITERQT